jgi:UDP-GlcNAc:undecaprenyl-phosphate/decaprenyl-phosphate GlcNAc-1-phosphate transferase
MYWILSLVSCILTIVLIEIFLYTRMAGRFLDVPNHRSLHTRPVPRVGGLALVLGALAPLTFQPPQEILQILSPTLLVIAVSVVDDIRGLSVSWRLLAQAVAGTLFCLDILLPVFGWVEFGLGIFILVWMSNVYNFMDGIDGLASGMAFVGFSTYGAVFDNNVPLAQLNFCIVAASLAVLFYNFYPAKIFLGDAGSITLGFCSGAIGILGWVKGYWPAWLPFLIFSPFFLDASVTLIRRLLKGENVWESHKEHYYQRLVQMGWGHKKTACAAYLLMVAVSISAVWGLSLSAKQQFFLLSAWGVVYALVLCSIDLRWKRFSCTRSLAINS